MQDVIIMLRIEIIECKIIIIFLKLKFIECKML